MLQCLVVALGILVCLSGCLVDKQSTPSSKGEWDYLSYASTPGEDLPYQMAVFEEHRKRHYPDASSGAAVPDDWLHEPHFAAPPHSVAIVPTITARIPWPVLQASLKTLLATLDRDVAEDAWAPAYETGIILKPSEDFALAFIDTVEPAHWPETSTPWRESEIETRAEWLLEEDSRTTSKFQLTADAGLAWTVSYSDKGPGYFLLSSPAAGDGYGHSFADLWTWSLRLTELFKGNLEWFGKLGFYFSLKDTSGLRAAAFADMVMHTNEFMALASAATRDEVAGILAVDSHPSVRLMFGNQERQFAQDLVQLTSRNPPPRRDRRRRLLELSYKEEKQSLSRRVSLDFSLPWPSRRLLWWSMANVTAFLESFNRPDQQTGNPVGAVIERVIPHICGTGTGSLRLGLSAPHELTQNNSKMRSINPEHRIGAVASLDLDTLDRKYTSCFPLSRFPLLFTNDNLVDRSKSLDEFIQRKRPDQISNTRMLTKSSATYRNKWRTDLQGDPAYVELLDRCERGELGDTPDAKVIAPVAKKIGSNFRVWARDSMFADFM